MTTDPGLSGERKNVTAVFLDLVSFSTISSTADAEDLQIWLDDYYRQARAILDVSGGEITEFLGDGIVAIFGLGRADELSTGRAVDAALQAVTNIRLSHGTHGPVALRAGIATGDVVARAPTARDGLPRITGGVTTLAQRLQAMADPGTVVIADETLRMLRGAFETQPLGAQPLKGFATPLPLHHVIRRRPIAPLAIPAVFVGRADEIALLSTAREPVLIVGEAGVGKTALVAQIARSAPLKTVFQADAIKRGASYQPFRDWALNCLGDAAPDDATLAATFPGLSDTDLRAIALVLGLPSGQMLIATLSNLALKSVIEAALWRAIRARQPRGLLLFEDLHWFDVASFGVLTHIFASPDATPYQIILTSREDTKLGLHLSDPAPRIIGLRGLNPTDSTQLLDTFSGGALPADTRQIILDRAGGMPLFLEHLWLRGATSGVTVPATLMDLLGERIDATGDAKPLLQRAAALGRTFRLDLLRALQPDAADPEPLLHAAALSGVVEERAPNEWAFRHALLAEAAYQSMLRRTREDLHARVAALLTGEFVFLLARDPVLLADHQRRAGQLAPAIASYLSVSQMALLQGAFPDAEAHARAAIAICAGANSPDLADLEIASHTALGSILMQVQGFTAEPVRAAFDAVLTLASAQPVQSGQTAPALFGSFSHAVIAGDGARAARFCDMLQDMAAGSPPTDQGAETTLAALTVRNCLSFYSGDFADQLTRIAQIRDLYRIERHAPMIARYGMELFAAAQMFEAPSRAISGQIDKVFALVAETDAHQTALSIPVMQPYALIWGAVPLFYAGAQQEALSRIQKGLAVATEQGAAFWQLTGSAWQFVMDPGLAADDAGCAAFAGLVDLHRAIGANVGITYFAAVLADRLSNLGKHDAAYDMSARAVAEVAASGLHCWQAEILRLHARHCRATNRVADADAAIALAAATATRQGAALWSLRIALDLATLHGRRDAPLASAIAAFPPHANLPDLHAARALMAPAP